MIGRAQAALFLAAILSIAPSDPVLAQEARRNAAEPDRLWLAPVELLPLPADTLIGSALTQRDDCDPIWDGFLAGILPGIGASFLYLGAGNCEHACSTRAVIIGWGAAGAAIGGLVDQIHCGERERP